MGRCDMTQQYQELTEQLAALVDAEWPMVSNLANELLDIIGGSLK